MRYKNFNYQTNNDKVVIIKYIGYDRNIVIPSEINNSPVVSITNNAFYNCNRLTSVTIPDSVTTIGDYAFYYCSSLTSVTIPDSVTSIGNYAFWGCWSLTSIEIPDSVIDIKDNSFSDCFSLKAIKCNPGSYSEKWALDHGFKTEPIMSKLQELLNETSDISFCSDFDNFTTKEM